MLALFQLRVRDLLWLMLVCALLAHGFRRRDSIDVEAVIHSPIYIVGPTTPSQIGSDRYFVALRGARGWCEIYEPGVALKRQLDRLKSDTVPARLDLASPVPPPAP